MSNPTEVLHLAVLRRVVYLAVAALVVCAALPSLAQPQPARMPGSLELQLSASAPQRLYEQSYALVIGASAYRNGWSPLPGVPGDVKAVAEVLRAQGFEVTPLADPTRDQLDLALRSFVERYGQRPGNRLLIYFAGHGHTLTTAQGVRLGYIVPVDAPLPSRNLGGFKAAAYSMEGIEVLAKQMDSRHALFVFDSCFAGTIFRTRAGVPDSISEKTARPVRQFITAGDEDQRVPDESIFRRQLVAALRDGEADLNRDGYITGSELGMFLEDKVTDYSKRTQTPRWGKIMNPELDRGDFVFVSPRGGQPIASARPEPVAQATPRAEPVPSSVPTTTAPKAGDIVKDCDVCPELVVIPAGSFEMGSNDGSLFERPQHRVSVASFLLGKTEVTQGQWRALMGSNPSGFGQCGDNCPVERVSWKDAQEYVKKLSERTGKRYRLPSEAEWEYAARAGTKMKYWWGDIASHDNANYGKDECCAGLAQGRDRWHVTAPVGEFPANAFGLFDMHGNVHEWVQDVWHDTYNGAPADGSAWVSGGDQALRVFRGGAFIDDPDRLRTVFRYFRAEDRRDGDGGMRIARSF